MVLTGVLSLTRVVSLTWLCFIDVVVIIDKNDSFDKRSDSFDKMLSTKK